MSDEEAMSESIKRKGRRHRMRFENWQRYFTLLSLLALAATNAHAQSDYYSHLIFDNSLTDDRYFHSEGRASSPSTLALEKDKLPIENKITMTPPNALRLEWRSAAGGGWEARVDVERWRNRETELDGDTLYFWCYTPASMNRTLWPRLQLQDADGNFTSPFDVSSMAGDVPAKRWVRVSLPLGRFTTASLRPFAPQRIQSVFFLQGAADDHSHTLIIDEIKVDRADAVAAGKTTRPLAAPQSLRAVGYDRHIALSWSLSTEKSVEHYVIYRSFDGANYRPIGIRPRGDSRYTDFLGKSGQRAFYKITASDRSYRESKLSTQAGATTVQLGDDDLLTMVQEACFRYYWDGAHTHAGMSLENIPGDENIVATGASGFGIMAVLVGIERGFVSRAAGVERLTRIADFLATAERFHGVWPHFLDGRNGRALPVFGKYDSGGDLVETAFLMQGLLAARQYFTGARAAERSLNRKITALWETIEWDWYRQRSDSNFLYWHWSPVYAWHLNHKLIGWNETMIVYLLAIASPTHGVPPNMYFTGWASQSAEAAAYRRGWGETSDGEHYTNGKSYYGIKLDVGVGSGGPLFFAHYSLWVLTRAAYATATRTITKTIATWPRSTAHTASPIRAVMKDMERTIGG